MTNTNLVGLGVVFGCIGVLAFIYGGTLIEQSVASYEGIFFSYDVIMDPDMYDTGVFCVYGGIASGFLGLILLIAGVAMDDSTKVVHHHHYHPPQQVVVSPPTQAASNWWWDGASYWVKDGSGTWKKWP